MRIANNVEMLELEFNGSTIYPVLLWEANKLVLIDAGFPGQTDAIVQAIGEVGCQADKITDIILTHQDIDHVGCVADLLRLAPGAKVVAHQEEAPYIDGSKTPVKLAAMLEQYNNLTTEQKIWCDRFKTAFTNLHVPVSQTVSDGEVLPVCGGMKIIHTPGHTPGHICLFLQESRIMVYGDAANIADGVLVGPNPDHSYDLKLGAASFAKIKTYPMRGAVCYHSGYLAVQS